MSCLLPLILLLGSSTPEEVSRAFLRGNRAFDDGDFEGAAAAYEEILAAGVRNVKIHYNLGNAYLRAGDLGRAILHYRRGERLDPGDPELQANLRYARTLTPDRIEPLDRREIAERIFFWHSGLSGREKASGGLLMVIVASALGMARIFRKSSPLAWGAVACLVIAVALGGSLAWEVRGERVAPPAVVLGEEVVVRKGNGESYAPAFEAPVHAGAEVRVLERREDWVLVEFLNGKKGWMRGEDLAIL